MVTLSGSVGAVGALATYYSQLSTGPSSSGSAAGSDEAHALVTLVQGTDAGANNLGTLLGTSTSSSDGLGNLLGNNVSSTDGLLTQISSLASALASGTSTDGTGTDASDSSSTDTSTAIGSQAQITALLTSAYANQQQGILSLLV